MCGIAGILRFAGITDDDRQALPRMLDAMAARGPDDRGTYASGLIAMGMVRLSIIDVGGGRQPVYNEDKTVAVVFNGEIYNYIELRAELQGQHTFVTHSDTEILVHGYEQWGIEGLLERIAGMFAFALYDHKRRQLFVARDRMGIKPLFYYADAKTYVFASDLKSLMAHSSVPCRMNSQMLSRYLSLGYPAGPETFYQNVFQLSPGYYQVVSEQQSSEPLRYWNLTYPARAARDSRRLPQILEQLDAALTESIKIHQRSDVPYGAFLSGGLDSTTVVAMMYLQTQRPVKTFSIGFKEKSYDESHEAELVARHYGTEHHHMVLDVPGTDELDRMISAWDQPNADYSCLPTYKVSEFARQYVKVVLTGDGGDEIFAGYPTHFLPRITPFYRGLPRWFRHGVMRPLVDALPTSFGRISFDYKAKLFVRGADQPFERGHYLWKLLFAEEDKAQLLQPDVWAEARREDPFGVFQNYFKDVSQADPVNQVLYVDCKTFLLDDNQHKVDRMTMANSLEARLPLLDHKLVELVCALPPHIKLPGLNTKGLLRRLMRDRLPPRVLSMSKKGFSPPIPEWLRGPLYPYLRAKILDSPAFDTYFRRPYVEQMIHEYHSGQSDHNRRLWALLVFLHWHEQSFRS